MRSAKILFALMLASQVWSQAPGGVAGVALSAVPLWPQDGDTSQLPKRQNLFYDLRAGEYVVYYVPDSGDGSPAQPTMLRFGSHALVDPEVTFAVAPTGDGHFRYTYKVKNGARARQAIRKASISDYADSGPRAPRTNWTASMTPHSEQDLGTPAVSQVAMQWTANDAALSIAPGSEFSGFALDSTALPGFINMTFQGDSQSSQYSPEAVASLPQQIRDQLARVFDPRRDAQSRMVIGPRFAKDTSQSTITQNYLFALEVLVLHRELDPNSPFVQSAQHVLSQQLESQELIHLTSGNLTFTQDAKPGLETAIAHAMEIAFAQ